VSSHQPGQEVGRVGSAGEELGVRTAVRHAGNRVGRVVDHLGVELCVEAAVGAKELDLEIAGDREIEHRVDLMLAFLSRDLADRFADVFLRLGLVSRPAHDQITNWAADAGLDCLEFAIGLVVFALNSFAQRRIFHLGDFFGVGPGSDRAPRRARVVEVPMLEREREAGAQRGGLPEDRQALLAASLEPCEAALMNLGIAARGRYRVVKKENLDGIKFFLDAPTNGNGAEAWILFRASGTEPLLRAYAEAASPELVTEILTDAESFVKNG